MIQIPYLPLIGALALATGVILQRNVLKLKRISIQYYHILEFSSILLVMLPLIYFFWKVDSSALQLKNVLVFGIVIVVSLVANMFTFYSMKWENVGRLEPAKVLEHLFIVLLALVFSFFFSQELYERNFNIIVPSIIAGIAIVFSHVKKNHLEFNKYFLAAIAGSFFFAFELVISRLILDYYSPMSFYFLRAIFVMGLSFMIFRPKMKKVKNKVRAQIFAIGTLWVIYRLIIYYGYVNIGIVSTTLVIMLWPVFLYIFAWKFLKEKISWKNVVASLVIVLCILYVLFVR